MIGSHFFTDLSPPPQIVKFCPPKFLAFICRPIVLTSQVVVNEEQNCLMDCGPLCQSSNRIRSYTAGVLGL